MDVTTYLERINYRGSLSPSADTLRELQVAHLLSVPFENLSIHSHEPIVLNDEALFNKIVERRRGGFCYECNGLFAALLRSLGFDVSMLSAEVAKAGGGFSQPFDHMTLLVKLEENWLVDVGFGDSFLEPLKVDTSTEQIQGPQSFRITAQDLYLVVQRQYEGEWKSEYRFTLQPYNCSDFEEMCQYHQTSPESHFTQKRICSLATSDGRITVSDMRFIVTRNGARDEQTLISTKEYEEILLKEFGIVM
ncbi:MAG TPA: arylamine N-acetyltransferase [Pyrinomonadaceae bacterium]